MRLQARQLASSLERHALAPLYLVSGDEPLQVAECVDEIRRHARDLGFAERTVFEADSAFDWNTLLSETATASLFSPRRIVELRLGDASPGKEGGAALVQYAENPAADTVLIISSGKIDKQSQQTKWFKALDNAGVVVQVWPVAPEQLPEWIRQRLAGKGKSINPRALALLADQVEGNLLAAAQEIDKLCLLTDSTEITLADVSKSVSDNARYGVFALLEACLSGDAGRCARMLAGLRAEGLEPVAIYPPLVWELRRICGMAAATAAGTSPEQLFREYRVWNEQGKAALRLVLRRHKPQKFHALLGKALHLERTIKSADRVLAWQMLLDLLLDLAGKPLMPYTGSPA